MNARVYVSRLCLIFLSFVFSVNVLFGCAKEEPSPPTAEARPRPPAPAPTPPRWRGDSQPSEEYPHFPWPPPESSDRTDIPRELIVPAHRSLRLQDVDQKITSALEQNGYYANSYYAIPAGFALVTKMEQIESDGTPIQGPERFNLSPAPRNIEHSLSAYLHALFQARPGYYRIIVFLVTPYSFAQSEQKVSPEEAEGWFQTGLNRLPERMRSLNFSGNYACTTLIYEFERTAEGEQPRLRLPGLISARTHLMKAGIWTALQQGP